MNGKVLIVDDSVILRRMIRKAVAHLDIDDDQVCEAGNGVEALALVDANEIRLVLLDLNMPVMDGEEFLRVLRQERKRDDVPVILVTTERNAGRLMRIGRLGVSGSLNKPFAPEDLVQLMDEELSEA